ncbi:AraC family transcriptional regulator [Plebeiibacterium sediminum]|uniref:Helix-turn-helix domain-containing protein n=1 Tax=Plebeiibacterium sediminum TaxID=2992112 RepID=A0AAE3M8L4_9BACT|nr:two-component regulator propeller domain-containing protein [Plebeiobacterium sediminum]MCW3788937.1 helix-turn-helix domain-containing protein [Plebeiobacterium sediminum]
MTLKKTTHTSLQFCLKIIIVFSFFHFHLSAQNISIRDIPSQEKLPVNAIHRIFQDSEGYMWYGTFNGLCRYDGYSIKTLRSDFYNPNLLKDNYITYINEDHDNKIWFGTFKGAYTLDKETYQLKAISLGDDSDRWIFSINVTSDGTIWVNVAGTLFRLNSNGDILKQYDLNIKGEPRSVFFVYEDINDEILISLTGCGMYKLDKSSDSFEPYFTDSEFTDIERIIWDETHQCYWLGTWGKGIVRFNPEAKYPEEQYIAQPLPVDFKGEPVAQLFHMVRDDVLEYLWVTTTKNIFAFQITENGTLEQVDTSPFLGTSNRMLYEIFKDRFGKMWVSSFDEKSFIIDIHNDFIKKYPLTGLKERINANPAIVSLYEDEGIFWLSQDRYGLCLYDAKNGILKHFSEFNAVQNLSLWDATLIKGSHRSNQIWTTLYNTEVIGLKRNNMEMELQQHLYFDTLAQDPGFISALYEDNKDHLWIGTTTSVFFYNIKEDEIQLVVEGIGDVRDIIQTGDGRIWILLNNKGICAIDADLETTLFEFEKDFVCADATSDGQLWIGTGKGEVLLFNPATQKLDDYSKRCGLNGDIINSIIVDQLNHVWITTNQSVKEYNPRNGAFRRYSTNNPDFLLTRLLPGSTYFDGTENIYFGGISGIISIPPTQRLEGIPESIETHISDIKIMGTSIWDHPEIQKISDSILYLNPADRNLEIEFSSLDFHNLDQVRYAYQLEGVDDNWVYTEEGKNAAFYNQLAKGDYIFRVKATDKNGLWSKKITSLHILRLPAWYESWWAFVLYFILIASLLGYIIYINHKRIELRSSEKWADSAEMVKMHHYIENSKNAATPEFEEYDKMLIEKATNIVVENLGDSKFNVEALASDMNMSRSTLSRKIKLITGDTSFQFIKKIKMHHACQMLKNKTVKVSDVMISLGYNDYKNFTESFKSIYGISPSEYQKTQCENE